MSKGSKKRPQFVSDKEFTRNWNRIFRKKKDVKKSDSKNK